MPNSHFPYPHLQTHPQKPPCTHRSTTLFWLPALPQASPRHKETRRGLFRSFQTHAFDGVAREEAQQARILFPQLEIRPGRMHQCQCRLFFDVNISWCQFLNRDRLLSCSPVRWPCNWGIWEEENDILTPFFDPLVDSMRWHAQVDFIF